MAAQQDHQRPDIARALVDSGFAALVTFGLSFPILALRTEQDMQNRLVVEQRWSWAIGAVIAVFCARLLAGLLSDWRARAIAIPGALIGVYGGHARRRAAS